MKRARDENGASGPQLKRHTSSRVDMSVPGGQSQQGLTTDDALAYLQAVKDMFKDKKGKYDEFLEVMKDFKAQRINTAGVTARVKDLFKGHRELILGFNTFLPKGYEITLPAEEECPKKQPVEFGQAISYVNKIKTRFRQDEQVYKAFLEILNMYRKGNKSIREVYQEVATLFKDHQDLLEEFTCFLPDSSGVAPPLTKGTGMTMLRREEKPGIMRQAEKSVKREKVVNTPVECDRSSEKAIDRKRHDHAAMDAEKEQVKKERDFKDEKDQKHTDRDDKDSEQEGDKDSDALQRLPNKRKSARRADELIRKQSQGVEGAEAMVGTSAPLSSVEDKKVPKGLQRKLAFFEHVKSKLRSRETYQEFLKCLNLYSKEIITRKQLHSLVDNVLGKYPDLVEGFNDFLAHCESNEGCLANLVLVSKKLADGPLLKPKVEKEREKDREREKERSREGERSEHGRDVEKEKERDRHLTRDLPSHKGSLGSGREKYMTKPISELDLSSCEQCTPSYRLLPKSYPRPIVSYRKPLAYGVLNDTWVSVTSGSEDYSFKHMRRNQYEESLFRCEDDRFELDMLLESTAVTAKRMEELLEKMQEANTKQDGQVHLDDHLTAINIRCIERIYGDHGLDVIDLLRKNASVALPVILSRLKQKRDEWTKCKEDMNKVWAEVYAKNYHKSLDHRSFYFKQQDKKNLSMKALLTEIKEINERKQKDDDFILSIAAGNRRSLIPDLRFEYPEPDVNEDLYQIIKHSADEMCTTMEQSDKIMRIWTAFFEPIFGVPSRSHGAEDTEEVSKGKATKFQDARKNEADGTAKRDERAVVSEMEMDRTVLSEKVDLNRLDKSATSTVTHRPEEITSLASATDELKINNSVCGGSRNETGSAMSPHQEQMHTAAYTAAIVSSPVHTCLDIKSTRERDAAVDSDRRLVEPKRDSEVLNIKADPTRVVNGRIEREEGELSPSPEADERLPEVFGALGSPINSSAAVKQNSVPNHSFGGHGEEDEEMECDGKGEGEHDADADDEGEESAPKSSDDSENPSEAGEEASASESGNADDSREDHEDDEDEQEVKNESEGEAEGMADAEGEGTSLASLERLLLSCTPLAAHASSIVSNPASNRESTVFYGNDTLYVLFRLHQALYERIHAAKVHAIAAEEKQKSPKDHSSELYRTFMRVLYNLLDGTVDNAKFEDDCRAIIGTQSYILFTMDKLIFKLVKQLQSIASDEMANKLLALHTYEKSRSPNSLIDAVYHANASTLLQDENIYRFEHRSSPSQLYIQLMEGGAEKLEAAANAIESSFFNYLNNFLFSSPDSNKQQAPIFLKRNKCCCAEDDEQTAMAKAMHNVFVANGLECKISCKTSKFSYVLDTEDLLFRRKWKRGNNFNTLSESFISQRVLKFRRWIDHYNQKKDR